MSDMHLRKSIYTGFREGIKRKLMNNIRESANKFKDTSLFILTDAFKIYAQRFLSSRITLLMQGFRYRN
jgi:hypothetical protein